MQWNKNYVTSTFLLILPKRPKLIKQILRFSRCSILDRQKIRSCIRTFILQYQSISNLLVNLGYSFQLNENYKVKRTFLFKSFSANDLKQNKILALAGLTRARQCMGNTFAKGK